MPYRKSVLYSVADLWGRASRNREGARVPEGPRINVKGVVKQEEKENIYIEYRLIFRGFIEKYS